MSVASFILTIKTDIAKDVAWVEGKTDQAMTAIWAATKPIFVKFEPVVVQGLLGELASFLGGSADDVKNGEASYIATVFLATLKDTGHVLAADAEAIGPDLLTVLAGLAKTAAAAA